MGNTQVLHFFQVLYDYVGLFIFRGLEDEAQKAMLRLRGPHYLMNAELEELKTILASEKQFSELAYASKYKELGSKKAFLPVATLIVMFSLQVSKQSLLF